MIIACPACNTRYAVPDTAIGVSGRTVRCAKCRHSWFQDGPTLELPVPPPVAPAPPPPPPPPPVVEPVAEPERAPEPETEPEPDTRLSSEAETDAPSSEPASDPVRAEPAEPVYAEPAQSDPPLAEPDYAERPLPPAVSETDGYEESQFYHEPPFRPRRNPARMWMLAATLFATVSLGLIAAVAWFGLPDWAPFASPSFADDQPGLKLEFPQNRQERRTLPDKSIYYGLAGTITNVGTTRRSVPSLLIRFRDSRETIVFSHELVPGKRVLAPGESVEINEAIAGVPNSAKYREIGWKPGS